MNQGTPHIVLAGGGTAGHVNPLLAVAGAIRDIEPTAQVTVIGTAVGLEKDLVPEAIGDDRAAVRRESAAQLGVDPNRPLVLVTGGSLGAQSLNRAIASSAADLLAHAQIIHLTGRGKISEVRELVTASAGVDVLTGIGPESAGQGDYHTAEYLERIDLAFACADLVICRAGAGSVSELAALGLPAIYVPLPIGNGEQRFNAEPVVNAGGGLLVADKDLTPQWVHEHVPDLLADHERLAEFGRKAWEYGIRNAAEIMARHVLQLAEPSK